MPVYEYYCDRCQNTYDSIRPMSQRDDPPPCPECGLVGKRKLSVFGFKYEGHYYMGSPTEKRRYDPHD